MQDALICLVFFGFVGAVIKMILDFIAKSELIKSQANVHMHQDVLDKFGELTKQINEVRDTSTQYDLSLQQLLDNLNQRVETIEAHSRAAIPASSQSERAQQTIGGA